MCDRSHLSIEALRLSHEIRPSEFPSLWADLQEKAFEAIKIAELEKSGIRDGDGYWHGSDVVGGILTELRNIVDRLRESDHLPF